jgi:hypothetical protein
MDVGEFQDLIDRWGEDISRWPDPARSAATDLVTCSAEANTLLENARMLRRALSAPPVLAPAGLVDRIVIAAASPTNEAASDREVAPAAAKNTQPG